MMTYLLSPNLLGISLSDNLSVGCLTKFKILEQNNNTKIKSKLV